MAKVPDILIERIVLGELPETEKRRLLEDPEVRRRVQELELSNREILTAYPPEQISRRIAGRLDALRSATGSPAAVEQPGIVAWRRGPRSTAAEGVSRLRRLFTVPRLVPVAGLATLVIAAGLLLVVLLPGGLRSQGPTVVPAEESRLKGLRPHLVVYHKTQGGAETLRENDTVGERDVLQLGYVSAARPYGVIVSIDGRGVVTLHFPAGSATAGNLEAQGEVLLPFAYELDNAPDFERFFLVTAPRPFPVDAVIGAADRLASVPEQARRAPLELSGGLEQASIVLQKRASGRSGS